MPKLREYISIGFCAGYGDGDYRVSMAVRALTLKQYTELRIAALDALACVDRHWHDASPSKKPQETKAMEGESWKDENGVFLGTVPQNGAGED